MTRFLAQAMLLIMALSASYQSMAQTPPTTCSQNLKKAQATYDEGRINEVSDLLLECLVTGFNKEEKIAAYKLLTLTNLYYNERGKAENSMLEFLKLNPEYEIDSITDPIEFINLYNTFRTRAIFNLGLMIGTSMQDIDVTRSYSVENTNESRGKYSSEIGYRAAIALEITRWKKTSIYTELVLSRRRYTFEDKLMDYATTTMTENQTNIELPFMIKKNLGKRKTFMPYVNFGPTFHYLFASKSKIVRKDEIEGITREVVGSPNSMDQRHKLNYSLSIGGGLKLKNVISNGYIVFDVRYNYGLRNIVNPNTRNDNPVLIYDYLYIDSDFRMNTLQFSIGYIMPKYKPKLKKIKANQEAEIPKANPETAPAPETK